eukprot:g21356.t1
MGVASSAEDAPPEIPAIQVHQATGSSTAGHSLFQDDDAAELSFGQGKLETERPLPPWKDEHLKAPKLEMPKPSNSNHLKAPAGFVGRSPPAEGD